MKDYVGIPSGHSHYGFHWHGTACQHPGPADPGVVAREGFLAVVRGDLHSGRRGGPGSSFGDALFARDRARLRGHEGEARFFHSVAKPFSEQRLLSNCSVKWASLG